MNIKRITVTILGLILTTLSMQSQTSHYNLFPEEMKTMHPSIVYDFLERYLFEIDSLERKGELIYQRLNDDKVYFLRGSPALARKISSNMSINIHKPNINYYQVSWSDLKGNKILEVLFPIQYELLLGKSKPVIEKEFKRILMENRKFAPISISPDGGCAMDDGCIRSPIVDFYFIESLNTATYFVTSEQGDTIPIFDNKDKLHSAANLFQGVVDSIEKYNIYVVQNLYGFQKECYTISLKQWLSYCQSMKLKTYFAIEEERDDGLKALLLTQSIDLGFNHIMQVIIPEDFVTNKKVVFKATLNAYIPTQNVKNLFQQHVAKQKSKKNEKLLYYIIFFDSFFIYSCRSK